MKASVTTTGVLTIIPETEVEGYALEMWVKMNREYLTDIDLHIEEYEYPESKDNVLGEEDG